MRRLCLDDLTVVSVLVSDRYRVSMLHCEWGEKVTEPTGGTTTVVHNMTIRRHHYPILLWMTSHDNVMKLDE